MDFAPFHLSTKTNSGPPSNKLAQMGTLISPHEVVFKGDAFYVPRAFGKGGYLTHAAAWCGYCTRLAPHMQQASQAGRFHSFVIDGDAPGSDLLRRQMNVSGFPTIMVIDNSGKVTGTYEGERTANALIQHLATPQQQGGFFGFGSW